MRKELVAVVLIGLLANGATGDPKDKKADSTRAGPSLKVGDPAPPLKASKWLQGEAVKQLEAGKVYVVEFWATWCGPCIVMMPHLAEMHAQYKGKGVTFIGYTAKDPNNSQEKVTAFVKKRGPKLKYTFAYADDHETYDAWMKAAGRNGIPCSFVVDKDTRIAYIGHPMYLDLVLPKVLDGSWKRQEGAEELGKIDAEVNGVFSALNDKDPQASLKALTDFQAKHPALADIPYFVGPKLSLLLKAKKEDQAKKLAERVMKKAAAWDDAMALRTVSTALRSDQAKDNQELLALAVKAAEGMVKAAGDDDALALINLASTYFAAGDKGKAREYGRKAVTAASKESAGLKQYVEQQAKQFDAEKKEDKK